MQREWFFGPRWEFEKMGIEAMDIIYHAGVELWALALCACVDGRNAAVVKNQDAEAGL